MKRDIKQYESAYLADYGFESVMVEYRRKMLLERLLKIQPKVVVEVGCGSEILYGHYLKQARPVDCWIVVEPGQQFFEFAQEQNLPNFQVIKGFFEDVSVQLAQYLPGEPDLVICSGVLHEVPNAHLLLATIAQIMGEKTLLHVNVPNAMSLHRRLAKAMGLIQDLTAMSERNQQLLQQRVYDLESLAAEMVRAGLAISESGGYLIKPFTHAQMEVVSSAVDEKVLDGLYELGKESPEWASEIYVEARLA